VFISDRFAFRAHLCHTELLQTVDLQEAYAFVEANPHPRLWGMLADAALERLDLTLADKAFVLCRDYHGITFVKRLRRLAVCAPLRPSASTHPPRGALFTPGSPRTFAPALTSIALRRARRTPRRTL